MSDDTSTRKISKEDMEKIRELSSDRGTFREQAEGSVSAAVYSVPGKVRSVNEDSCTFRIRKDGRYPIAMVADGICGQQHGEIASRLCIDFLSERWEKEFLGRDETVSAADFEKTLEKWLLECSQYIYQESTDRHFENHMGTTVVAMVLFERNFVVGHTGDSRLYRIRKGQAELLTQDHTWVQNEVQEKRLTPAEAAIHPFAHVLLRSIGVTEKTEPEVHTYSCEPGDRFILCSDGLTLHLDDIEIGRVTACSHTPGDCVRNLVDLALSRGGRDNVTVSAVFI